VYLQAMDDVSKDAQDASFVLDYNESSRISEGVLRGDAFTPAVARNDVLVHLRCWSDHYYFVNAHKSFSGVEVRENASKVFCDMQRIGGLHVSYSGSLNDKDVIFLNVTAVGGSFYRLGACFAWSPGIIRVLPEEEVVRCESGLWRNWTVYYEGNESYDYLPFGVWRCGEEVLERCSSVFGSACYVEDLSVPHRFLGKVDKCSYTGKTLQSGESYVMRLGINSLEHMNQLDYLEVRLFDADRRWNIDEKSYTWYNEYEGDDIGAKDIVYRIPYSVG